MKIALNVNGAPVSREVEARQNLVDFLRYELGLTGSHIGCEHGVCGACTVRVDGKPIRGCLMLAAQADGCQVETIEGVAEQRDDRRAQGAFRAENALQCGFCTPGMLLTAQELLDRKPDPDPAADPRSHRRQLLPLHRISRHRPGDPRRGGAAGRRRATGGRGRRELHRALGGPAPDRAAGGRPGHLYGRRGAPGSCTPRSCGRPMPMRASRPSTPRMRPRCPGWWPWSPAGRWPAAASRGSGCSRTTSA